MAKKSEKGNWMKRIILALLMLIAVKASAKEILISFDGSDYLDRWEDTLDFAKANGVKFTYFISAPYFVTEEMEQIHPYWAMHELSEKCLIKPRANSQLDAIAKRVLFLHRAVLEGNDIASHLCGHYDGRKWTYGQWMKEFAYFKLAIPYKGLGIVGVRAPFLCTNVDYFRALKDSGYGYDSSTLSVKDKKYVDSGISESVKEIPIKKIKVIADGYTGQERVAPFDCDFIILVQYNLFPDTQAIEGDSKCADPHILEEMKKMEDVFFNSLCYDYLNDTRPTQICLHFQKRSGESYWNATKRFVEWVKDKDPKYMTYKDYYSMAVTRETIAAIEKHDASLPPWKDPGQ